MHIEKISAENLKRAYRVTVPAQTIDSKIEGRLAAIGKTLKMPGFRPGKVPAAVVKKNYGKSVIGEVLDVVLRESSQEALTKEGLRPAMQPKIEILTFKDGQDLTYSLEVELLPEIPVVDLDAIEIEKPVVAVADQEVAEALERIATGHKHFHPVKDARAAKQGDAVVIDFAGSIGGEPFEGGTGKGVQLELGSSSFIPGFEEQLVGIQAGGNKTVRVTFPQDYHAKHLAGKEASFEVTAQALLEPHEHHIDDEFAREMGLEGIEQLKGLVRKQLESEVTSTCRTHAKKALFDALDARYRFQVPEQMLAMEFDAIWKQIEQAKKEDPKSPEFSKPEKALKEEYREMAERRVRLGILLSEYGRNHHVTVTREELKQAVFAEAGRYPGQERKVLEYYRDHPEQAEAFRGPVLEEKVVDFMLEKVKVREKTLSLKELQSLDIADGNGDSGSEKKPAKKKKKE